MVNDTIADLLTHIRNANLMKNATTSLPSFKLGVEIVKILKEEGFIKDYEVKEEEASKEKIVKRKNIETKPMDEEEAILEMELLGHSFFVYKDMDTNNTCVLYKRKDGDYGLIETK